MTPILRARAGQEWTGVVDAVVVGGGVAGLSTAVSLADLGASVCLVDKGAACGGTTRKAAAGMMVPNNRYLREAGGEDPKEDFVRLLARIGRPLLYDPAAPRYGLPAWEHALIEAYYDNASAAFEHLEEIGALRTIHQPDWPTYNEVPEDRARFGRVLFPRRPDGSVGDGAEFLRQMLVAADRLGVTVVTGCRATGVFLDDEGAVVGVRASGPDGPIELGARKAVVFASGGFTHNEQLRREHLNGLYAGGCAALTSEGDFVPVVKALGVPLVNMHAAWGSPLLYEHALRAGTELMSNFAVPGDSIVVVNKYGRRVGNEKATYNDRTQVHFVWDPARAEYPNYLLFAVWDQRNTDRFAAPPGDNTGNFIPADGDDWSHVVRGDTLADLAGRLSERLDRLAARTGGVRLEPDFAATLGETVASFNAAARAGVDPAFHRGESAIELFLHGPPAPDNGGNATMFPISDTGPYYATILAPGAIETKGGPKTNARLQVLDANEEPVPGLYAVGNCAASPSGQAYWSGGSTFGPYVTFGYVAARSIVEEPERIAPSVTAEPAGRS